MVAPSQKERPQRFVRSQINFNTLDHVGHGTKVVDKNQVIDDRYKKEVSSRQWHITGTGTYIHVYMYIHVHVSGHSAWSRA